MQRLFIADPALKGIQGHHYNLSKAVATALEEQSVRAVCLVNKAYADKTELHTVKCFSTDTYDGHKSANAAQKEGLEKSILASTEQLPLWLRAYRKIPPSTRSWLTPLVRGQIGRPAPEPPAPSEQPVRPRPDQEMQEKLAAYSATGVDRVLFHTCDAQTYHDVANYFEKTIPLGKWMDVPSFHLSTPYDELVMPHNKGHLDVRNSLRRLRNLGLLGDRVFLHAENVPLARHLSEYFKQPVTALPIPPSMSASGDRSTKHEKIRITYLGAARTEKGFCRLPDLVERGLLRYGGRVSFFIQGSPQIMGYTADVQAAVRRLQDLNHPDLTVATEPLSGPDYDQQLNSADVLLLPYDEARYRVRGSGIAVEALLNGAILLATKGTFPEYIGGEAAVGVGQSERLIDGLEHIVENFDTLAERAQERRQWYLETHSNKAFYDNIVLTTPGTVETATAAEKFFVEDSTQWQSLV